MKFLYSLAPNSFKNIGNFLKSFPNKIYSVEIKIKSRSNDQASSSNTKIDLDEDITLEHKQSIFDQISRQPILKQHNDLSSSTINTQQEKKSDLSQQQIIDNVNGIAKSLEKFGNKTSLSSLISLNLILKQLVQLLQRYPEVSSYAIRQRIHSKLLRIRDKTDSFYNLVNAEKGNATKNPQMNYKKILNENSRQILSMFGHADQPKGRGIRVLSIDGGGTKGLTSIEILRQIEQQHGKPIHEIFDLICGVSTGAIIAMLLGALRISIDECESYYRGSSHKIWEAVRASSAAPGFFEEFTLNKHVHQDGGILINNPTAVAVHEAKLLWPKEEIQCVVSLGSGRHIPPHLNKYPDDCIESDVSLSSLKHKITRLIDSATDTEMIHRLMQDMMPNDVYYRFNPTLTDPSSIDENRSEKLQQLSYDAQMYLRKNGHKFSKALEQL
ncbi:calcium-independent phospholipase A2-gamma-like protein, partial [Sarcoptes scabiei]